MIRFKIDMDKKIQAVSVLLRCEHDRMSYFRMLKLLYIADREALAETGKPIVGSRAVAMPHGPLHSELLDIVKGQHRDEPLWSQYIQREGYQICLKKDPGRLDLSPYEIEKLTEVSERYTGKDDWQIASDTHEFEEYRRNYQEGRSTTIPLEHILEATGQSDAIDYVLQQADAQRRFDREFGE